MARFGDPAHHGNMMKGVAKAMKSAKTPAHLKPHLKARMAAPMASPMPDDESAEMMPDDEMAEQQGPPAAPMGKPGYTFGAPLPPEKRIGSPTGKFKLAGKNKKIKAAPPSNFYGE